MKHKASTIPPEVVIVDTAPRSLQYLADIVEDVIGVRPRIFYRSLAAFDWFYRHPARTDLVIVREAMPELDGFHLLRQLDAMTPRPVHAVFLIQDKPTAADAENWFYGLDETFAMIQPLKAVRYPWFKHHIATALLDAFPWHDPAKKRENHQKINLDRAP
jgi:response regulator RpfG family c-di-GMP phosphodiesterase